MATAPMRVPQHVKDEVESAARLVGQTPGELLEEAWKSYRESPNFRADFEAAQKALQTGDLDGLAQHLRERGRSRAAAKADRIQRRRSAARTRSYFPRIKPPS
jgi:hypothetical protein